MCAHLPWQASCTVLAQRAELTCLLLCRDGMQVQQLVGQVQFSGMTPMGTQLDQKACPSC